MSKGDIKMKAQYISVFEIKLPTPEDYLEDGITFKDASLWYDVEESTKPADVTVFKDYSCRYSLVSENFGDAKKIVMSWQAVYNEPAGRVGKLSNGYIVTPKTNETINGNLICNYNRLPNSRKMTDGWLLVEETAYPNDGKSYIQKGEIIPDETYGSLIKVVWEEQIVVPPVVNQRVSDLRTKYISATHSLCQLAGVEVQDKLEDTVYETVVIKAMSTDAGTAMMLTQTIMYCFFQLKLEDGIDAWLKI